MTADALHLVARANLGGSVAVVVVALLRGPARSAFGAPAAYRLWGLPLIVALAGLVPAPQGGPMAPVVVAAAQALPMPQTLGDASSWPAWLGAAWVLGAVAFGAMLAAQQARFAFAVRGGEPMRIGGVRVVRARRTDIGPAVAGRTVVLPLDFETRFTAAEQAAILAHESQHLARGDVMANALVALIQCLCWFNPLVHLAARWLRVDQELACDAAVMIARPGFWRPYAEALLKTQVAVAAPPAGCAWRARGFRSLRDRIRLLKRRAPGGRRRALGAVLLVALTLGGGYAAWASQPSPRRIVTQPDWSGRPTGADVARFYPADALARHQEGMAVMQCRVGKTGALSGCAVLRERPQGAGFGTAALRMAPRFRMKPMSIDGRAVAGGVVRIPFKFKIPASQPAPQS